MNEIQPKRKFSRFSPVHCFRVCRFQMRDMGFVIQFYDINFSDAYYWYIIHITFWCGCNETLGKWSSQHRKETLFSKQVMLYRDLLSCEWKGNCNLVQNSCNIPVLVMRPSPPSNVDIHMSLIHSWCTILDNLDFGEWVTEVILQNVPTVLYKIVGSLWIQVSVSDGWRIVYDLPSMFFI